MKKLFLSFLVIAVFFAHPVLAQLSVLDAAVLEKKSRVPFFTGNTCTNVQAGSGTTLTCTFGSQLNSGDHPVFIAASVSPVFATSITSDKGDSCGAALDTPGSGFDTDTFFCASITPGAQVFTVTFGSATTFLQVQAIVVRNTSGVDVHTGAAQSTPGTATDAVTSGSVTTTHANDLLVGLTMVNGVAAGISIGTRFSLAYYVTNFGLIETLLLPPPSVKAATFTAASASSNFTSFAIALKP